MERMLSVVLQIHRNILSSQCYIKCVDDSTLFNAIQIKCFSAELELLMLSNDKIVKKVKIISPNDFFIPSSLSSDSESSVISGSTIVCQATLTPTSQAVVECSFRLQISGSDKLFPSETELKVDVQDFFKERFKNGAHWNLFCANCGAGLSMKPVYIESVREYCESELSEGWFCHANVPQPAIPPSSQILYLDDISFYLYPTPDINRNVMLTYNAVDNNCVNKSAGDCSKSKIINDPIDKALDSLDFSKSSYFKSDIDLSCIKQCNSSTGSCTYQVFDDSMRPITIPKNHYKKDSNVGHSAVECKSCGEILTTKKFPIPFIRFYYDKLMFKNSSFMEDHQDYACNITMLSFWSLVKKGQTSSLPSKLFLQCKVRDEDFCLLLWVPSVPVAQFLLQDSFKAFPSEIHMRTELVYKVLYFVGTSLSENVRSWRHDFGVDFHHVSDTMIKTLTCILRDSTNYLPQTFITGGFSCGFLKEPSQLLL